MGGLPPLGGVPLGWWEQVYSVALPPAQSKPCPHLSASSWSLQGVVFTDHTTSPPLPPQAACQGFTSSAPLSTAARSAAVLLFQTPLLILQITSSSNLADPSLATLANLSQDLAIELAALPGSSGRSSSSSNLPMGRGSPAPQIVKPRAPGPPGAQPH